MDHDKFGEWFAQILGADDLDGSEGHAIKQVAGGIFTKKVGTKRIVRTSMPSRSRLKSVVGKKADLPQIANVGFQG